MIVSIRQSKTDQMGQGQQLGIPYLEDKNMCAVLAVKEWISKAELSTGPLFRRILKSGVPATNRLSDKTVNLIVKKYARRIGLQEDLYGAHSLRHGFATYAALHGVEERIIMKQTRHRSEQTISSEGFTLSALLPGNQNGLPRSDSSGIRYVIYFLQFKNISTNIRFFRYISGCNGPEGISWLHINRLVPLSVQ